MPDEDSDTDSALCCRDDACRLGGRGLQAAQQQWNGSGGKLTVQLHDDCLFSWTHVWHHQHRRLVVVSLSVAAASLFDDVDNALLTNSPGFQQLTANFARYKRLKP